MSKPLDIVVRPVAGSAAPAITPGPGEIVLSLNSRQWACDVLAAGASALPHGDGPLRQVVLPTAGIPTLDEMLAASFVAWMAETGIPGAALAESASAFARYAAAARAGFSPSRTPPETSIAGIYHALTWPFGARFADAPAAERFVAQWQRIAAVLRQAIEAGRDPFTDQLFSEAHGFEREIISLRADHQVYAQDVKAGMQWRIRLAADSAAENSALLLRHPKSLLFKDWARHDESSPTRDGYLLLAVQWDDGTWVFSTDPVQRLSLKPLADALTDRESKKGGTEPWFDGAPFDHTLIAAPQAGTKLAPADVLSVFTQWAPARGAQAAATAPGNRRRSWRWQIAAGLVLALGAVSFWAIERFSHHEPPDPSIGATELDVWHVRSLKSRGTENTGNFALFVGVNEFRNHEFPNLTFAVDDAIAQAHLFALELDLIDPHNLLLALQGEPGTRRGRTQLAELKDKGVTTTTAFRADILDNLAKLNAMSRAAGSKGLLIVSISSHGLQRDDGAYVIPSDGLRSTPSQDIAVADLNGLMNASTATKHLLIVDACRETPRSDSRDIPPCMSTDFLHALAAAGGQSVMASCSQGQLSYEVPAKGHGIFTYWMLMGLKGAAPADARGMITVGTMETYLKKQVADYSSHHAPGLQEPWFSDNGGSQDIPLALPENP